MFAVEISASLNSFCLFAALYIETAWRPCGVTEADSGPGQALFAAFMSEYF